MTDFQILDILVDKIGISFYSYILNSLMVDGFGISSHGHCLCVHPLGTGENASLLWANHYSESLFSIGLLSVVEL